MCLPQRNPDVSDRFCNAIQLPDGVKSSDVMVDSADCGDVMVDNADW